MKRKLNILLAILLTLVVTQPAFASSMSEKSITGALVGKIVTYDTNTNKYIIYGRMSVQSEEQYRIYQTGKFYYLQPLTDDCEKMIKKSIGKGIKAFGTFESFKQTANSEVLYAKYVIDYNPSTDPQPAYGGSVGPTPGILFGVPSSEYSAQVMQLDKPWNITATLCSFKRLFPAMNLSYEKCGDSLKVKNEEDQSFDAAELSKYLLQDKIKINGIQNTLFKKSLKDFWKKSFKENYLIAKDEASYQGIEKAQKGYAFIQAQKGQLNQLVENVPAIRPNLDKFMITVEKLSSVDSITKWATPAIFYGYIKPSYILINNENQTQKIYNGAVYTGPYYASSEDLVTAITQANSSGTLPNTNNNRIESWPIGYKGNSYIAAAPGLSEEQAIEESNDPHWLIGTRVLVYLVVVHPAKGKSTSSYVAVENGNLKEGTVYYSNGGSVTTSFAFNYIKPSIGGSIEGSLTKTEFNYLLTTLREVALKGGF